MSGFGRDGVSRAACSFSRSAAAQVASSGGRVYVWLVVEAESGSTVERPRPRLLLMAAEREPSAAIEFVRYELAAVDGWPETGSRPEVFVDDWLEPPRQFNFKNSFLPWAGLLVSLGTGAKPTLTSAAAQSWVEQYVRDSDRLGERQMAAQILFGVGVWMPIGGLFSFWYAARGKWVGAWLAWPAGVLLIGLGVFLIYWAFRVAGPIPGWRRRGNGRSSRTRKPDHPRGPFA